MGGNSLIRAGQRGTIPEQLANASRTVERIADIVERGYRVVITHGNGPQVGSQLLRSEAGSSQTYSLPLDVCVAMTQGEIGYILLRLLQSALRRRGIQIPVTAQLTQVLVEQDDPEFGEPTKPIGPFYSKEAAERKKSELGWNIMEDAARGYRRVVPSPKPCSIVELEVIQQALNQGSIVIAAGGGGIPVVATNGTIEGIEAVIDKDRASALLASQLGMPRFLISTDTPCVYTHYRTPSQAEIRSIDVLHAKAMIGEGQFPPGSMKPKIEAALEFLQTGGAEVIITDPDHLLEALEGAGGTHITRGGPYETSPCH